MHSREEISSSDEGQVLLSAGEAAEHLDVKPSEIERMVDAGLLSARHRPSNNEPVYRVFDLVAACRQLKRALPPSLAHYDRRVLVAEDDQPMARAIARVLRGSGYTMQIAPDGFQASSVVESFCPALIILDLNMPHMPGLEVLKHLRNNPAYSHIKIVVVSAAPPEQLAAAKLAGADCVVEKPFDNAQLLQVIAGLLAN